MKSILAVLLVCVIMLGFWGCDDRTPMPDPQPKIEDVLPLGIWNSDHQTMVRTWPEYSVWEEGFWIEFHPDGTFDGGYSVATRQTGETEYTTEEIPTWGVWRVEGTNVVLTSVRQLFNLRLRYEDGALKWPGTDSEFR